MDTASHLAGQIDRQVRRWQLLQRASTTQKLLRCVALSRLPASGAEELGRQVAEKCDYGFFGIELLDYIARERHVDRQLLSVVDEKLRSVIERSVGDAFRHDAYTESDYLRHIVRSVTTLGEHGGAVLLGRGAPYILSGEQALRVLVVAPKNERIGRIAAEQRLGRVEAEGVLDQLDAERREFIEHHFHVDPDDPTLYDLVVNTGTLGLDTSVRLVLEALQAH